MQTGSIELCGVGSMGSMEEKHVGKHVKKHFAPMQENVSMRYMYLH